MAGIHLSPSGAELGGLAIGDSCILVQSPGSAPIMFPAYSVEDLQRDPYLVSTLAELNDWSLFASRRLGPLALPVGLSTAVLMTDAVARWFLHQAGSIGVDAPFERLLGCACRDDFEDLVRLARLEEGMKNDDCTLVVVQILREENNEASHGD